MEGEKRIKEREEIDADDDDGCGETKMEWIDLEIIAQQRG